MNGPRPAGTMPRGFWPAAGALVLVLYGLPLALGTPLLDPDEGLHAAIAQEMVERGDWITPRFLGTPFLDKPVLFFWSLAVSLVAFGFNEFAIKLPGLGFGVLGAIATGLFAGRLFGRATGWLAAVFYGSLLMPLGLAQSAVHDVALVPWTTLALLGLWQAARASSAGATVGWGVVAGIWIGLAILTKALTGVALIGLPFALWALAARRLRPSLVVAGLVSLLVGGLVAAPWYLAMEQANPGYLHYYFVERHLLGFTTTTQLHGQRDWWFYLPVLLGGGLPWVMYMFRAWRGPDVERDARWLPWIWLGADLVFLSAAGSKLQTYLLPAFPAVAILAAVAWRDGLGSPRAPSVGWRVAHVVAFLPLAVVLPAAFYLAGRHLGIAVSLAPWAAATAAIGAAAPLAVLVVSLRRDLGTALVAAIWGLAAVGAAGITVLLPTVAPSFTARELARHFNASRELPRSLWFYDERVGSFVFYLLPELRAELTPERLVHATPGSVLGLRQPPPDTVVVMPLEELARLERRVPLSSTPSVLAGHHRVYTSEDFVRALRAATGDR